MIPENVGGPVGGGGAAAVVDRRARWFRATRLPAYLLPLLLLYGIALVGPVLVTGQRGFSLSTDAWSALIRDPLFTIALRNTIVYCLIVTVVSTLLGYAVAAAIWRSGPLGRMVLTGIVVVGLSMPVLVKVVAWRAILQNTGVVNEVALALGLIAEPMKLYPGGFAMGIGMIHWALPFSVFPILAVMMRIDHRLERAAESLGAGPLSIFRHVVLPLTVPGFLASFMLVLVLSLGFYVIPEMLGGQEDAMISNLVALYGLQFIDFNVASAISLVLLLLVASVSVVHRRIEKWASA